MRIISGQYKKKKLLLPDQNITRPLRDYVKESIFNFLLHNKNIKFNFHNSNILDIFSGSGSFGIECLSRGCAKVFFVEKNIKTLKILKKNIESINSLDKCEIINKDIDFNFENSTILDIFSGSGSFGIECLSRGSAKVFFVEKNTKAIKVLEKNISSINSKDKCEIINKDILHIDLSNLLYTRINLIFLDPPFNYELWNELIKKINFIKKNSPECIIVIHQEVGKKIIYENYFNILLQKKYGISLINFARFNL